MASLANQTISSTYDGLVKTSTDQPVPISGVQLLEDGVGNSLALSVGRANQGVTITGTLSATSISGVLADGVTATTQTLGDNSTKVATTAYVDAQVTAEDLDFAGDSGTGAVDLDSQTFTIAGTVNEIETSASGQTITIGLPSSVTVDTLTATTLGGTLSTAAQPNITSVGTLSSLTVGGALNATISTAAQPNITSVGTLSSLAISGNLAVDTNTLYVHAVDNKVGIKTTSIAGDASMEIYGDASNYPLYLNMPSLYAGGYRLTRWKANNNVVLDAISPNGTDLTLTNSNGYISFATGASERLRIDGSGNVGIGTTPKAWSALGTTKALQLGTKTALYGAYDITSLSNNNYFDGAVKYITTGYASRIVLDGFGNITFANATTGTADAACTLNERMRISETGNVGIGTSSPAAVLDVRGTSSGSQILTGIYANNGTTAGSSVALGLTTGSDGTLGRIRGQIIADSDGDNNGYLGFTTRSAGSQTERMRITSGGFLKASNTGTYSNSAGSYHEFISNTTNTTVLEVRHSAASNPYGIYLGFTNASPNNTNNYFFAAVDSTNDKAIIYSNGTYGSRTNTYGAILSDERYKENIVDTSPKLDKIMQVKVRNFNLIGDDLKQIGVIAQEVEQVFPSLVYERELMEFVDVEDEDGNITKERQPTGETAKAVKDSIFTYILLKAVQEQQEIINDLKARIETLENK